MTIASNSDQYSDPDAVARAKAMMAGPLGTELSAFPIRFAEPLYFGDPPAEHGQIAINNGTASLVDLGNGPLAVTCAHVIAAYRDRLQAKPTVFQIGNLNIDPLRRLIAEDPALDLAVLSLAGCNFDQMHKGKVVDSAVFQPPRWPPTELKVGDFVSFGGYPGAWRTQTGPAAFDYDTFSVGATPVTLVREDYFVCHFEREFWIGSHENARDFRELGGLSGAPVFCHRHLHAEWVGVIYEWSADYDLLYSRPADLLTPEGRLLAQS